MANCCCCNMSITGPLSQRAEILEDITSTKYRDLCQSTACFSQAASLTKNPDSYDGNTYMFDMDAQQEDEELVLGFWCKWSPLSTDVILDVSRKYPELLFKMDHEESGCCFAGYIEIQNGEVLDVDSVSGSDFISNREAVEEALKLQDPKEIILRLEEFMEDGEYAEPIALQILKDRLDGKTVELKDIKHLALKEA